MNDLDHLISDGQPTQNCPYCGEPLDESGINGLHTACNRLYAKNQIEYDRLDGDSWSDFDDMT